MYKRFAGETIILDVFKDGTAVDVFMYTPELQRFSHNNYMFLSERKATDHFESVCAGFEFVGFEPVEMEA